MKTLKQTTLWITLFSLMIIGLMPSIARASVSLPHTSQQTIKMEEDRLKITNEQYHLAQQQLAAIKEQERIHIQAMMKGALTSESVQQAKLKVATAETDYENAKLTANELEQAISSRKNNIRSIEAYLKNVNYDPSYTEESLGKEISQLQSQLMIQKSLLDIERKQLKVNYRILNVNERKFRIQQDWQAKLLGSVQTQKQISEQHTFTELESTLQKEQSLWLNNLSVINKKLTKIQPVSTAQDLETHLALQAFVAQSYLDIISIKMSLAKLHAQANNIGEKVDASDIIKSAAYLREINRQAEVLPRALSSNYQTIERKKVLINKRISIESNNAEYGFLNKKAFDTESSHLRTLHEELNVLEQHAVELQTKMFANLNELTKILKQRLSNRQGLPGLNLASWSLLGQGILQLPAVSLLAFKAMTERISTALENLSLWWVLFLAGLEILLFSFCVILKRQLKHFVEHLKEKPNAVASHLLYVISELVERNVHGIFIIGSLTVLLTICGMPLHAFSLLYALLFVLYAFKGLIDIFRFSLLENINEESDGHDVVLYHRLKWVLVVGAVLTVFLVLSDQLPITLEAEDLINRLFMGFILAISLILLRRWYVIPRMLDPFMQDKRPYLAKAVRLLCLLVPFMLLTNAVLGLSGYLDLAWRVGRYQFLFLLVLAAYVLSRGLLIDFMEWISTLVIRYMLNGWLWTQAFLKPIHKIMRIGLLVLAWMGLFLSYGWGSDSYVVTQLRVIVLYPMFHIGSTGITLLVVVQLVVVVSVIYWIARWSREFAYRWLFSKTSDLGMRNSLSVFIQYGLVATSSFIGLKVIGIDLQGMAFILGGLAVGLGFGMRDLANNFVSGIFLLIERPIRKGDIITVGEYEGEVMHIGMRSITLRTWDHTDVIVPNADTFHGSFTNWTRMDNVVRSVVSVKIQRTDDPHKVQGIISRVLGENEDVLTDPAPQVFLKELDDSLIEFEIRYFINILEAKSRPKVRSAVLFALWDEFKKAGVKAPVPQQQIYFQRA